MGSRLLWRRSATAVGMYSAALLGFLGQVLAARTLGPREFGQLAIVIAVTGFFQLLMDLTVEEAVIKYGFRYSTAEDWGRLRRLFRRALSVKGIGALLAGIAIAALAPAAHTLFGADGLVAPLLVAAFLPLAQSPEGMAGATLILQGRYDVRGYFLALSMALRCAALGVGSQYGVTETVIGVVLAQVVATAAVCGAGWVAFRRFPEAAPVPLGSDRRAILGFVGQSTLATAMVSARATFAPLMLGIVANPAQVGFFRAAQAPQVAFATLTAPVRLILLTEQTRDWERGARAAVLAGVRRFTIAAGLLALVLLPPALWFMPDLIRLTYSAQYLPATDAARLILAAAALQAVVGWTKSLPVSIGRPGLRVVTHGIETAVLVPLVVALGALWGATGAAAAVLVATGVFVAVWVVALSRIRRDAALVPTASPPPLEEALVP